MWRTAPDMGTDSDEMIVLDPSIARAARAYTGLSHIWLGKIAGVASRTVYKLEKDGKVTKESLDKILDAFERMGVVMLYDDRAKIIGMKFYQKDSRGPE
jgi:hypothetical protein